MNSWLKVIKRRVCRNGGRLSAWILLPVETINLLSFWDEGYGCVCECVSATSWEGMCVFWLTLHALAYSNYIVCLSHTIAVPVFVVAWFRGMPGTTALPVFWQKEIYSHTMPMRRQVCVAALSHCWVMQMSEYLGPHKWSPGFRLRVYCMKGEQTPNLISTFFYHFLHFFKELIQCDRCTTTSHFVDQKSHRRGLV